MIREKACHGLDPAWEGFSDELCSKQDEKAA
jgi:hypothetical protein